MSGDLKGFERIRRATVERMSPSDAQKTAVIKSADLVKEENFGVIGHTLEGCVHFPPSVYYGRHTYYYDEKPDGSVIYVRPEGSHYKYKTAFELFGKLAKSLQRRSNFTSIRSHGK